MPMSMNEAGGVVWVKFSYPASVLPSIYMLIGTSSSSSCQYLDCCLFHLNKFICIRNENLYSETLYLRKHCLAHTLIFANSHSCSHSHEMHDKLWIRSWPFCAAWSSNSIFWNLIMWRVCECLLPTNATTNDNNPGVCWRKIYSRTSFSFVFVS